MTKVLLSSKFLRRTTKDHFGGSFLLFFILQILHPILRFLNHFSGVVKKYFGINATESTARARANSGKCKTEDFKLNLFSQHFLDQIMSLHLMQCHRPSSIQDLCETTKYYYIKNNKNRNTMFYCSVSANQKSNISIVSSRQNVPLVSSLRSDSTTSSPHSSLGLRNPIKVGS